MGEKYQAEVVIYSQWIDNTCMNVYDPTKYWNPQLVIENIITTNKETITYNVSKRNDFNEITETRHIKGK